MGHVGLLLRQFWLRSQARARDVRVHGLGRSPVLGSRAWYQASRLSQRLPRRAPPDVFLSTCLGAPGDVHAQLVLHRLAWGRVNWALCVLCRRSVFVLPQASHAVGACLESCKLAWAFRMYAHSCLAAIGLYRVAASLKGGSKFVDSLQGPGRHGCLPGSSQVDVGDRLLSSTLVLLIACCTGPGTPWQGAQSAHRAP